MGLRRGSWFLAALILGAATGFGVISASPGYLTGFVRWIGVLALGFAFLTCLYPAWDKPLKRKSGEPVNPVPAVVILAALGLACLWMGIGDDAYRSPSQSVDPRPSVPDAQGSVVQQGPRTNAELERQRRQADEALIVGRWIDPVPYGYGVAIIKRSGSGYVLLAEPTEVKHYQMPLTVRDRHGHRRFYVTTSDPGDWFEILADGRLQGGDKEGKGHVFEVAPAGADKTDARAEMLAKAKEDMRCNNDVDYDRIDKIRTRSRSRIGDNGSNRNQA